MSAAVAIFGTAGTGYAALAIWLLVRVINKQESLVMALAALFVIGFVGSATAVLFVYLQKGC